jgi:hypothetical protein
MVAPPQSHEYRGRVIRGRGLLGFNNVLCGVRELFCQVLPCRSRESENGPWPPQARHARQIAARHATKPT